MTFYVEWETENPFSFESEEVARMVMAAALEREGCPYEAQVSLLFTDEEGIRLCNRDYRGMDRVTDVLSFPGLEYEAPADFSGISEGGADCFDPESGELLLGDILICVPKVQEQAAAYGHSEKRELAFLIAHSMLHLMGYDHMEKEEAEAMEHKQEEILLLLGIGRD